jgi:hypothetical protein
MNNRDQNRQFRAAVREIERILERSLSEKEWDRLHREVSKRDFDFDDVISTGLSMFN